MAGSTVRCSGCIYWRPLFGTGNGQCRLGGPERTSVIRRLAWPRTLPDDWCGEAEAPVLGDTTRPDVPRTVREAELRANV
jgi:hypothetical protein